MMPCPACGEKEKFTDYCPASFIRGDERWIRECGHCGLSVLWPLPGPRELNAFYNQGYYNFNRRSEEGKGYYYARVLRRIREKGRILDIGCATGFFLSGIRQNCDWEVYGQETGKDAAAYAREKMGLPVKDVPLEKAGYPGDFFDFIHLNNVLEHVADPAAVMNEAGRILKPEGRLYLAVPNGAVDRFGYRDYHRRAGERAASMDGHLYFFSPRSLSLLANNAGLRIKNFYSCGLKRALRVLGYWPRKRDWQRAYQGRTPGENSVEKAVEEGRAYPRIYYLWKHGKEKLLRFPFFSPWTYDFNIYLKK
jgi:SAM-dependent methyltransferase